MWCKKYITSSIAKQKQQQQQKRFIGRNLRMFFFFMISTMMELGITQSTNIHKTRSLNRTLKYVLYILQTEEAFTVEE